MASLNWVQLSVTGRPIPLPTEEPLLSPLKSIELSLYAIPSSIHSTSSATTSAILSRPAILSTSGTLFVSTTRLVFVRSGASPNNINGEGQLFFRQSPSPVPETDVSRNRCRFYRIEFVTER
jgi:hypothetical protein